jgi:dTDP-4-dehydrorhamnose reductase
MICKILLFGSTGMLGTYIHSYFNESTDIEIAKIEYRVTNDNLSKLADILVENGIDKHTCIINCIGLIPQRKPINIGDHAYYLVNSIFPQVLSSICQKYGAKMIQPTTDCVYSGTRFFRRCPENPPIPTLSLALHPRSGIVPESRFYTEDDLPDEPGNYGMSKSLGEPANCTVIRTSIIGCERFNKRSFLEWVLANSDKEISGWSNHYWNGITCLEYCKIIRRIIENDLFWNGVRHIYSPTPVSKYELACMIRDAFGLDSIRILETKCEKQVNKTLSSKYERMFDIPELYEQIKELKHFALI